MNVNNYESIMSYKEYCQVVAKKLISEKKYTFIMIQNMIDNGEFHQMYNDYISSKANTS